MTEAIRDQVIAAIKGSATEVWSPWYVLGFVPDNDARTFADVATSRWRSRKRRKTGRRDPVRDLARGFAESQALHPEGEPLSADEREDYLALASQLVPILSASPPEAGFARREAL